MPFSRSLRTFAPEAEGPKGQGFLRLRSFRLAQLPQCRHTVRPSHLTILTSWEGCNPSGLHGWQAVAASRARPLGLQASRHAVHLSTPDLAARKLCWLPLAWCTLMALAASWITARSCVGTLTLCSGFSSPKVASPTAMSLCWTIHAMLLITLMSCKASLGSRPTHS